MKKIIVMTIGLVALGSAVQAQHFPKPGCTTLMGDAMFGMVDTTKPRGVSDNYHTWANGQVLNVKFMPGGSKTLRNKVMAFAKEWEKYANIKFQFVADTAKNTQIRIRLGKGYGHNSAVGTEANFRPQSMQTMNFDTLFFADADYYIAKLKARGLNPPYNLNQLIAEMKTDPNHWNDREMKRVVVHEFGHALGLLHEQSFPGAVNWKKTDSVYNYYYQTQGWDRAKVDFNVFETASHFYTNGTEYDPKSIMHYAIQPWETVDGYSVENNYELSAGDKKLIAALYPKDRRVSVHEVPKVDVSNVGNIFVTNNPAKRGISVYPSFDVKTNSKMGQVYFVARLATEDGYYIKTDNPYYNWGGTAATYMKMNMLPNSKTTYNKGSQKNLELFFPFEQMPELYGQKVMVVFAVYMDDVANGQMDKLMYFSTTQPLSITK